MDEVDPEAALSAADAERERRSERAVDTLEWFRGRDGLVPRGEAVAVLADEHGWSEAQANVAIGDVVGDLVDPVQQVVHPERGKLVGVIEYQERPESGGYGYVDYDGVDGKRKRVVCSQCVKEAESDGEVAHATAGSGSYTEDASWAELFTAVEDHYNEHDVEPSQVEVGASLVSGTTISGSISFHKGNDGTGSGLDADTLDGADKSAVGTLIQQDISGNAFLPGSTNTLTTSLSVTPPLLQDTFTGFINGQVDNISSGGARETYSDILRTVTTANGEWDGELNETQGTDQQATFTGYIAVNDTRVAEVSFSTFLSTNEEFRFDLSTGVTGVSYTNSPSVTWGFDVAFGSGGSVTNGVFPSAAGYNFGTATGSTTVSVNPTQTRSPLWASWTVTPPTVGSWGYNTPTQNGSLMRRKEWLINQLTTEGTLAFNQVSYSNVGSPTTWNGQFTLYEGEDS